MKGGKQRRGYGQYSATHYRSINTQNGLCLPELKPNNHGFFKKELKQMASANKPVTQGDVEMLILAFVPFVLR